ATILFGSIVGWQAPAIAGSDNSSDTYAGDYQGGSLPPGTFLFLQYMGYSHSDALISPAGVTIPNSHAKTWEEYQRFVYFTQLFGHPLVLEGEIPFATLTDVNLNPGPIPTGNSPPFGALNNRVAGGLTDPVVHLTYFFTADAKIQRWIGFTNYFYLPLGRSFDNTAAVNVSTPRQFTDVPQIGWTEGLGKFSPSLNGFFVDFVANASFHTDGDSPLQFGIVGGFPTGFLCTQTVVCGTYDKLTQKP